MLRASLLAAVVVALWPAPAGAQLRALAPDAAGPVFFGDRVVWADGGRLLAAPIAAGDPVPFGSVPFGRNAEATLAASRDLVAVQVRDTRSARLFAAGADGAFRQVAADIGDPPLTPWIPGMQVSAAGIFTLEDATRAYLRDGAGPAREVALPPGADPERAAAAGGLGVAPTPEGALAVFDLRTDIERDQISLGRFDPSVTGLAISPEGDVAATVPVGDGDDVLLWARAGASRVRVLARGRGYSRVAVAGGRVAFVGSDGLREGERVTIVDPATNRVVFRGPPASEITSLAFDGRNVAFSTPACALAGPMRSRRTIPPGPCSRTDVAVSTLVPAVRHGRYGLRVACINAPARRCRVSAVLRTRSGAVAGRERSRVPVGSARELAIRPDGRASRLRLTVRVTDPGGSSRVVYTE